MVCAFWGNVGYDDNVHVADEMGLVDKTIDGLRDGQNVCLSEIEFKEGVNTA